MAWECNCSFQWMQIWCTDFWYLWKVEVGIYPVLGKLFTLSLACGSHKLFYNATFPLSYDIAKLDDWRKQRKFSISVLEHFHNQKLKMEVFCWNGVCLWNKGCYLHLRTIVTVWLDDKLVILMWDFIKIHTGSLRFSDALHPQN